MSESSVYHGIDPYLLPRLTTVDFVQLRGYFVENQTLSPEAPHSLSKKGKEIYICIDQKLLKFYLNPKTGGVKYSSQIVIKSAKEGYSDAKRFEDKLYLMLNPSFNSSRKVLSNLFNYKDSQFLKKEYLSNSEKFYVLVWDLKKKKPEFKIRFRSRVIETLIRPKLIFFALKDRLSIFERSSLSHLLKVPIKSPEGIQESIEAVESISCSREGEETPTQILLFLPKNSSYLLFLRIDECLDLQFSYVAQRKRTSVNRRTSRISGRISLPKNSNFLEESNKNTIMSFGKKKEAVMEDIEEGTDTDPEKEGFGLSSSIYFNGEMHASGFKEKSRRL